MIEIPRSGLGRAGNDLRARKRKGVTSTGKTGFASELHDAVENECIAAIDDMLLELGVQEKRFIDLQSIIELEKYKIMIKKILKYILEEGFESRSLSFV